MTATAEDISPEKFFRITEKGTEMEKFCPSHEHVIKSGERQEEILEAFRSENAAFKEKIHSMMAEICAQLKKIEEIKGTQVDNMRRREDFGRMCEEKRMNIWTEINRVKNKQDKDGGLMILIAGICTSVGAGAAWLISWLQKH